MNIFISWSKNPSREIAELLKEFLEKIFNNNVNFFVSSSNSNGIDPGEDFRVALSDKLTDSNFGILILTEYNYGAPWLMFEAGAIFKDKNTRIIPILFNRSINKKESPIETLNHILYEEESFSKLILTIQKNLLKSNQVVANEEQLLFSLKKHWNAFQERVDDILKNYIENIENIENIGNDVTNLMMDEDAYEFVLAKREDHLKELIDNLPNDNSSRIIIVGGISTILRKDETILAFAKWLTKQENPKLFICHENETVAQERAKDLPDNIFKKNIKKDINKNHEIQKRKIDEFQIMKKNLIESIGEKFKKNIFFIELTQTLTSYITIQGTTIFFTPVLDKRSSDTFTFKLKQSNLHEQLLDYISSKTIDTSEDTKKLQNELEKIKLETRT